MTDVAAAGRGASDRRAEILRLAADLFAERGFKATTVRDIADAAGVLSGSLYHHFNSKESIIEELLREYVDELLADYRRKHGLPSFQSVFVFQLSITFPRLLLNSAVASAKN